jgi:flagellar motility protein MotE (MotC chaperone)
MADKKMTKEEARAMYDKLHKAMTESLGEKGAAEAMKAATAAKQPTESKAALQAKGKTSYAGTAAKTPTPTRATPTRAPQVPRRLSTNSIGVLLVAALGCAKVTLSALVVSSAGQVQEAQAVVVRAPVGPKWTKEEAKVLTALDGRRVELEERSNRLEKREDEFSTRERELAIRMTELKELSERLKLDREKGEKQRNVQLDQLANVYGSMNPPEAAHLLEQLDIQVCLSLIERMPEKRMGQILSLMNPQRALELTNLLSKRKA